jgi:sec-independent protein translocase protein TatA
MHVRAVTECSIDLTPDGCLEVSQVTGVPRHRPRGVRQTRRAHHDERDHQHHEDLGRPDAHDPDFATDAHRGWHERARPIRVGARARSQVMNLGATELLIVLGIVLLIFGSTRLPKLARSLGQASKEFKAGAHESVPADDSL